MALRTYTPELAKFRSGYLLKDILDRSAAKSTGQLIPNRTVWMYSTHDTVLFSMLRSLGFRDFELIEYAACLLFEVLIKNDNVLLQIVYKKSPSSNSSEILNIPNCGTACPLDKMYELYKEILPSEDFVSACSH